MHTVSYDAFKVQRLRTSEAKEGQRPRSNGPNAHHHKSTVHVYCFAVTILTTLRTVCGACSGMPPGAPELSQAAKILGPAMVPPTENDDDEFMELFGIAPGGLADAAVDDNPVRPALATLKIRNVAKAYGGCARVFGVHCI